MASDIAQIELTKFRFRLGAWLIVGAVILFIVAHLKPVMQYFTDPFAGHAWFVVRALMLIGAGFAGPEVVKALASVLPRRSGPDSS